MKIKIMRIININRRGYSRECGQKNDSWNKNKVII